MVHLVRNAVAHGIEPAAERLRAGKPVEATLRLSAQLVPGGALIGVADDGRGLDVERIVARAVALGWASPPASAEDAERLAGEVIWRAGFSTASEVSTLAGRGVGLDAVTTALHGMGGSIEVTSARGRGSQFLVRVPTSLALARGLLCHAGGQRFLVDLAAIRESVRVRAGALERVERQRLLPWRGGLITIADPGEPFGVGLESPTPSCLVLESGSRRRGLLVDRTFGQLEVVVQPLAPALGRPRFFSGATILAGGDVALVLDAARVVEERDELGHLEAHVA
jgi:two-component system chemotaxis sensor kinase CheA